MAWALLCSRQEKWKDAPMSKFRTSSTFIALTLAVSAGPLTVTAEAGDWTNSASYNGYGDGIGTGNMNSASNYSMRDANGNLTMVNGQIQPSIYSNASGSQFVTAGVGMAGAAGQAYGQATAIGNSLNVIVIGSHNTTSSTASRPTTAIRPQRLTVNTH